LEAKSSSASPARVDFLSTTVVVEPVEQHFALVISKGEETALWRKVKIHDLAQWGAISGPVAENRQRGQVDLYQTQGYSQQVS